MKYSLLLLCCFGYLPSLAHAEKGQTVETYLQSLSSLPDILTRRDPFEQAPSPFQPRVPIIVAGIDNNAPVLLRFPIQDYVVVAVLLGDVYPRALVRAPSGSKSVLIVKEKDRLGNQGGIISRITDQGLVVTQKKKDESGYIEKVDYTLPVGIAGKVSEANGPASGGARNGTQN